VISNANASIAAGLKAIWKERFGDDDKYMDLFFAHRFKAENSLVHIEEGKPVSMLFWLPAHIWMGGSYAPINYVYGVATLSDCEGRGLASSLTRMAKDPSLLVPSSPELFEYYAKLGYRTAFFVSERSFDIDENARQDLEFSPVSPEEYNALRDLRFKKEGYIKWSDEAMRFAFEANALDGAGGAVKTSRGGDAGAVIYSVKNDSLIIQETTFTDLTDVAQNLALKTGAKRCVARVSPDMGDKKPFAMLRGVPNIKTGYFNIALD
jgi:hypothetical protein